MFKRLESMIFFLHFTLGLIIAHNLDEVQN